MSAEVQKIIAALEGDPIFHSRQRLLVMLDYDGTLVPFASRPEQAVPPPRLLEVLNRLLLEEVALAVISGRPLQQLEQLLPLKGLILAGLHGAVIRHPGEPVRFLIPKDEEKLLQSTIEEINSLFLNPGLPRGFWVENKGISLAVHFRNAPDHQVDEGRRRVLQALEPYLEQGRLELLAGDKVLEVRPTGVNKGQAVRMITGRYPHHYPIYIGDDFTDEDAFKMLGDQGLTIRVTGKIRKTAARWCLTQPEEVLIFLKNLLRLWTSREASG